MPRPQPQIVAWEITRRCALQCRHCRGAARDCNYADELTTAECLKTIDALAAHSKPMIILTGGEPLMRADWLQIARHATDSGCRVVLATCGHRLDAAAARALKSAGVMAVSVSLDAETAERHNRFRGICGAYEKTVAALEFLRDLAIPFQINTTVTTLNVDALPQILEQAIALGAATMDFFFLVPTGRGAAIANLALDPARRDRALAWIAQQARLAPIRVKTTCAPQYRQFVSDASFRGCMGGRGFVFISHTGILQTCGFLDVPCGDLRSAQFNFESLYSNSEVFRAMRSLNPFAGCPARARARTGSYMEPEQ